MLWNSIWIFSMKVIMHNTGKTWHKPGNLYANISESQKNDRFQQFRVGHAIEKHHYFFGETRKGEKIQNIFSRSWIFDMTLAFLSFISGSVIDASYLPAKTASSTLIAIFTTLLYTICKFVKLFLKVMRKTRSKQTAPSKSKLSSI